MSRVRQTIGARPGSGSHAARSHGRSTRRFGTPAVTSLDAHGIEAVARDVRAHGWMA